MATLIDPKTGQVYAGLAVPKKGPHPYAAPGFVMLVQPMLHQIAVDPDLGGETLKVFMLVTSAVAFGNAAEINQTALATELGIKRQSVGRALKTLVEKQILLRDNSAGPGRPNVYCLNPMYGYKGSGREIKAAQQKHLRLVHVSDPIPELPHEKRP